MPVQQNIVEYHRSIANELIVLKDRVRNLIGSAHWGEDGRYKENILISALRRYLPENLSVGTGFVLSGLEELDENKKNKNATKQIDIIVYKSSYPLIFKEGDFVVVYPESVVGIIEVKTTFDKSKFKEQLETCEKNGKLIEEAQCQNLHIFNGIFYYGINEDEKDTYEYVKKASRAIRSLSGRVNHIAIGENYFVRYWEGGNPRYRKQGESYSLYQIERLSFAYFISNLVEMSYERVNNAQIEETKWFIYPLVNGKEGGLMMNIPIRNRILEE